MVMASLQPLYDPHPFDEGRRLLSRILRLSTVAVFALPPAESLRILMGPDATPEQHCRGVRRSSMTTVR
jgi:hypothetical protein